MTTDFSASDLLALATASGATALAIAAMRRELAMSRFAAISAAVLYASLCAASLVALGADVSTAVVMAALIGVCVLVGEIDRRSHIIPDTLVLAVALLALSAPFGDPGLTQMLGGAFLGALFYVVHGGFSLAGREDALGLGDVKFAAALGAFLGPYYGLMAVVFAGGATIAALLVKPRTAPSVALGAPFGIGLSAALCVVAAFRLWAMP